MSLCDSGDQYVFIESHLIAWHGKHLQDPQSLVTEAGSTCT